MNSASRKWPFALRRCVRCTRPAEVLVPTSLAGTVGACIEHLEWAFLAHIDVWTGRRRTV